MEIQAVISKRQLKEFIYLPFKLHKNHPNWVPPLISEQYRYFDRRHNPALAYCNITQAIAVKNGQTIGRIMGIENMKYNEQKQQKSARFALLECIDDSDVANALLEYVGEWAKSRGLVSITGPMGMCYQDPKGFQVEGFDKIPAVSTYCNHPYMIGLMEKAGYQPKSKMVVYEIDIGDDIPDFYKRIFQRIASNPSMKLIDLKSKRDLLRYANSILELLNSSFTDLEDFVPLSQEEMDAMSKQFLIMLNPNFVKIATYEGNLAGFMIAMPNISKGLMAAKGRILPFGFLKIRQAMKNSTRLDLLVGGIHPKYRGRGIDVLMGIDLMESARNVGITTVDTHLELEENTRVRAEMEKVGGHIYKRYQLFFKSLT